jgi:hypothetical protein
MKEVNYAAATHDIHEPTSMIKNSARMHLEVHP